MTSNCEDNAGCSRRPAHGIMAGNSGSLRSRKGRSMHDVRFDHLARALSGRATRRSALVLLAILGLANATNESVEVSAKRRRKKIYRCKCKPCQTPTRSKSKNGCCSRMKPDGSACFLAGAEGQCSGGACATLPSCDRRDELCDPAIPQECCSGVCGLQSSCTCSETGQPCYRTSDCCAGTCIGFVCAN